MSSTFDPRTSWERVSAELRVCKETQQKAYGDVDSATLGRYLAGEMSTAERATLEQTLDELPELRKLTDLVQDVLGNLEPIEDAPPADVPPPAPKILPLTAARPRRRPSFLRRYAAVAAAACLLLALGVLMPRPGFLSAPRSDKVTLASGVAVRSGVGDREARMLFLDPPAVREPRLAPALAEPRQAAPYREAATPAQPLNQVVAFFHSQGEVAQAAKTLRQAHLVCKNQLGPQHKATQWTALQLAGVYQFALNEGDEAVNVNSSFFVPQAVPADCPRTRARSTARMVREQITRQPVPEVRVKVVPVLTEALRVSTSGEERLALTRALGELGPAARPAVPLLCDRLQKSSDTGERQAILVALDRMGPAARDAVLTLTALTREDKVTQSGKKDTPRGTAKFTPREQELARQVLARLTGREARVGVFDTAGLFCLQDTIDASHALRKLARDRDLEVRIETLEAKRPSVRLEQMGPLAIHVVLSSSGQTAEVHVTKALRDQGLDPAKLSEQLTAYCGKGECNEALTTFLGVVKQVKATEPKK